jgi:hypothetical protein
MFRWYKNAAVCYAFLEGVPSTQDPKTKKSAFRTCRWFTRGWTLQELITPNLTVFFAEDWMRIGLKGNLCQVISEVTGIPPNILQGDSVECASIARRMSWASKRRMTRVEDIAYCLLGIFKVSMASKSSTICST